jgi:hypothetical protein
MEAPEFENEQQYFDHNKQVWDLADVSVKPKEGDQVIVECMSIAMDKPLSEDPFIAHYYRAKFVSIDEESQYCELKTLADSHFSIMKVDCLRVVPKEKVWEV